VIAEVRRCCRSASKLSSEEFGPNDLVRYAARAEEAGFTFALISDHYHPWIDTQGHSPVVWCVIGGVAEATSKLQLGTGVTCPTVRIHPAIVAQAAALLSRRGYRREPQRARRRPGLAGDRRPPGASRGGHRYGERTVCWTRDDKSAWRTAHQIWPISAMGSGLAWELALPKHFESVAELVTEDAVAKEIICGPDPDKHVEAIREYADAGYDHVCIHQVGPDQEGFIRFYEREVLPQVTKARRKKAA